MIQVNVHEAKSQLSRLIEAALAGEKVTIARAGTPVVDIVVHREIDVRIGADSFHGTRFDTDALDAPDEEIHTLFYEGSLD